MEKLDARTAAQRIRGRIQQPSAEDRHTGAFVSKVCAELGIEYDAANAARVADALADADIQPYEFQEYPQWVDHPTKKLLDKDGNDTDKPLRVIVNNEDELANLNDDPDAQTGLGVQSQYPKTIRVPDASRDGGYRDQIVRDLKEEREFLKVNVSAIDPEASTQYKKSLLEQPTADEIKRAELTEGGAAMNKAALDQANKAHAQPQTDPRGGEATTGAQAAIDAPYGQPADPTPAPKPPSQRAVPRRMT